MAPAVSALIVLLAAPPTTGSEGAGSAPSAEAVRPAGGESAKPPATSAQTAKLLDEARAQFELGNEHYAAGRFHDAIRHFQAGYALVPRPNFLVNLGQSYRKLGDLPRAKEAYVAYVRALPQNSALRDQALQVLAEIEVQLQEQKGVTGSRIGAEPPPVLDPSTAPVPPLPPPGDTGMSRGSVVALSVAGAGLALGGTGLYFQLRAKSADDELSRTNRNGGVFDPALYKRGRRDQRLGIGFMAAGGTALVTALILYLVIDGPEEPPRTTLGLHPGGMMLNLRF